MSGERVGRQPPRKGSRVKEIDVDTEEKQRKPQEKGGLCPVGSGEI